MFEHAIPFYGLSGQHYKNRRISYYHFDNMDWSKYYKNFIHKISMLVSYTYLELERQECDKNENVG